MVFKTAKDVDLRLISWFFLFVSETTLPVHSSIILNYDSMSNIMSAGPVQICRKLRLKTAVILAVKELIVLNYP